MTWLGEGKPTTAAVHPSTMSEIVMRPIAHGVKSKNPKKRVKREIHTKAFFASPLAREAATP